MAIFNRLRKASPQRQRTQFQPSTVSEARDEVRRRCDRDYLRGFHDSYDSAVIGAFQMALGDRTEHNNATLSKGHADLADVCVRLQDRAHVLRKQMPERKNLWNTVHLFKDLEDFHRNRSDQLANPTPQLPGFEDNAQ